MKETLEPSEDLTPLQETIRTTEESKEPKLPLLLYICDRHYPKCSKCTAREAGLRIDDNSVCQWTGDARYSLSKKLGISPSWSVDPNNEDVWVETTMNICEAYLVIPVNEITVEGNNA